MRVYIVDLESVETRYTGQWKTHIPNLLRDAGLDVEIIDGPSNIPAATSPGAFLNFGGTNIYKAAQVEKISRLFCENKIEKGDYFLFTDAWHPGVINVKYMSELLNIPVHLGGFWHAGSYDSQDFLGRLIGNEPWVRHAEKSFFHCFDNNFFATDFHIQMFTDNLFGPWYDGEVEWMGEQYTRLGWINENFATKKFVRTGWPFEKLGDEIANDVKDCVKRDLILFPHRIAPEKQPEIFKDLQKELPKYEFVMCQERRLTKREYHRLLGEAKIVFSANLQETLGISGYEALIANTVPLVPDRLSYSEMFSKDFKYQSKWTQDFNSYQHYKGYVKMMVKDVITNYDAWAKKIPAQRESLRKDFFSAGELINTIKSYS